MTVTNSDRAEWARTALDAFKASHKCDEDDTANIKDLVTDLLHLVRRDHGIVGDDLLAFSRSAYDMNFTEVIEDRENCAD